MGPTRGRIKRAGKNFYMPRRDSEEDVARDQELLNGISKELSVEEVIEAVADISVLEYGAAAETFTSP